MRVVFVDNLLFEDAEGIRRYVLQPHLGLISLIAVIENAGHEGFLYDPKVEIARGNLSLDGSLYKKIAADILLLKPDVVGLTSLGCNFICTVKVAAYLKKWEPELPIILGGPHATVLDRVILEAFPQFELIARNETEFTILPILEALPVREFFDVPGISFRKAGAFWRNDGEPFIEDLDSLPLPAYHKYPVKELNLSSLRVDAGRGCPFACTFCSTASFFGRRYRLKSAKCLVGELDYLNSTYQINDFALTHDLFTVNRKKVLEFCDVIEDRNYTWKCSARMDCVDDKLLERMYEAGCRSIYYGIEAGSERMQKISKKRLNLDLFDPILSKTQNLGMSATVSFITGYPEEMWDDQVATLDLIGSCFDRNKSPLNIQLHLLTPEPGTELLENNRDAIAYDGHISDFNFPALEPDDSNIIENHPDVFINHHFFPSILSRRRHIFVTTLYQELYSLGLPVLGYILKKYSGKLSNLVDDIDKWAEKLNLDPVCDSSTITNYFVDNFGLNYNLTGLVRYMLGASILRRRVMFDNYKPPVEISNAASESQYCLSPQAVVINNVPDCPLILKSLIELNTPPPTVSLKKRYDFLLYLLPDGQEQVQNFLLTKPSTALLNFLNTPKVWNIDAVDFENETGFPAPPVAFLDMLVEKGVLNQTQ